VCGHQGAVDQPFRPSLDAWRNAIEGGHRLNCRR
jgi:hypothetical protein